MSESPVVPHHIAIVMDGNGRWAKRRFLPRLAGHKQGVDSLRRCARACAQRGVAVLTVFAFSSENWNRPADEVFGLMELLAMALAREVPELKKDGVRLYFVGDRAGLSPKVQAGLAQAEAATAGNDRLILNVCFNYGGRWDIAQAAASLAARGEPITEASLQGAMGLAHVSDPDLVIRTGVKCGSAIFCCGRPHTPSSSSATGCGRISTSRRWMRRLQPTAAASAVLVKPPNRSCPRIPSRCPVENLNGF